mmetsp:Transcript_71641/g.223431  ORF Transcript_71641/g.223431 Transcript_71641/m.223431 type:complete len:263 (-) Transcript_71641:103-891(-)
MMRGMTVRSRWRTITRRKRTRDSGKRSRKAMPSSCEISHMAQIVSACIVAARKGDIPSIANSPLMPPGLRVPTLDLACSVDRPPVSALAWLFVCGSMQTSGSATKMPATPEIMTNIESPRWPSSRIRSPGMKIRSTEVFAISSINCSLASAKKLDVLKTSRTAPRMPSSRKCASFTAASASGLMSFWRSSASGPWMELRRGWDAAAGSVAVAAAAAVARAESDALRESIDKRLGWAFSSKDSRWLGKSSRPRMMTPWCRIQT